MKGRVIDGNIVAWGKGIDGIDLPPDWNGTNYSYEDGIFTPVPPPPPEKNLEDRLTKVQQMNKYMFMELGSNVTLIQQYISDIAALAVRYVIGTNELYTWLENVFLTKDYGSEERLEQILTILV
jgi:hypothetical protein